ncbi:MAG: Xaa-Pro aminopeptidase [Gammaproteobacteria bacterium]|nr:Xaa-Pro aminopeptidase [Gammaproteobacteria bacterium]
MSEYSKRRRQLMRMMDAGSIAIIPAAPEKIRNRDTHYPYRQDSDFWYLTGFAEPEAVAVLIPGRKAAEYVLFCRERDPERETWDGKRAGPDGACEEYGADDAFPIDDIDDILPGLMESRESVFYTMGSNKDFDQRVIGWVRRLQQQLRSESAGPQEFISLDPFLHDMRLFKSRKEISLMKRAAKVSVAAHRRAMRAVKPGMNECEIEAELLYEFRRNGGQPAYPSIVGGGANGCILHYIDNNQALNDGDLLLVDAGCEIEHYASDVTRTYPVNGKFSPEQRAVYQVVLDAQYAAIDAAQVGEHWNASHEVAIHELTRGLKKLGILEGRLDKLIRDEAYKPFYMHRVGHWLGIDVHDVGDYKVGEEWRELEPGMALTIEPGLYIPAGSKGVDRKWWNIGVRIEDDVVVTKDGPQVLSGALEKEPDDIEALMQR